MTSVDFHHPLTAEISLFRYNLTSGLSQLSNLKAKSVCAYVPPPYMPARLRIKDYYLNYIITIKYVLQNAMRYCEVEKHFRYWNTCLSASKHFTCSNSIFLIPNFWNWANNLCILPSCLTNYIM